MAAPTMPGPTPSADAAPTANKQTDANELAKRTYINERPAWFGFSFAVPLNSYRDVSYNETLSLLQPKTVQRQNIYAVGNVYVPPLNVNQAQFRYVPHLMFGVPIEGQPLRHLMLGLGIGLNWAEPFAGVVFNRQQVPNDVGTDLHNRTVRKLVYGINIPVGAAVKALAKK